MTYQQIQPNHPWWNSPAALGVNWVDPASCRPDASKEIYQLAGIEWPIYSIGVRKVEDDQNSGVVVQLHYKRNADSWWTPIDAWVPLPLGLIPFLIQKLEKALV